MVENKSPHISIRQTHGPIRMIRVLICTAASWQQKSNEDPAGVYHDNSTVFHFSEMKFETAAHLLRRRCIASFSSRESERKQLNGKRREESSVWGKTSSETPSRNQSMQTLAHRTLSGTAGSRSSRPCCSRGTCTAHRRPAGCVWRSACFCLHPACLAHTALIARSRDPSCGHRPHLEWS